MRKIINIIIISYIFLGVCNLAIASSGTSFKQSIKGAWHNTKSAVKDTKQGIKTESKSLWHKTTSTTDSIKQSAKKESKGAWQATKDTTKSVGSSISNGFRKIGHHIKNFFTSK